MKAKNRLINKNLRNTDSNIDIKIINENDEAFYKKVKEIVNEKEFVYNPIKRLMDENKMMSMTPNERERYLLQTIEKPWIERGLSARPDVLRPADGECRF